MPQSHEVSVVIAARNARETIGSAVASALGEPEVSEVILVDDASSDGTGSAALEIAADDPRLQVIRVERNIGPAAARNLAIGRSTAQYVALLDADDRFVPGRLGHLLAIPGWDLAADNIAFHSGSEPDLSSGSEQVERVDRLNLAQFVEGNLSGDANRGELGFLKPVIRRSFLERHGLAYDETIRLGEDYDLYVRCLQHGARFMLSHRVGYLARVREDSLSSRHGTADLAALLAATERHLRTEVSAEARRSMRRLRRQVRNRLLLREFLDRKATGGLGAALAFALAPPTRFAPIAKGILRDKLRSSRTPGAGVRDTLLPVSGAAGP